jgi:hypothetical protein
VSPTCFHLTQYGLINKVLHATNKSDCNGCETPATLVPLHTDQNGLPFEEKWEYDLIIVIFMYMAGNTRPDISYAVHQGLLRSSTNFMQNSLALCSSVFFSIYPSSLPFSSNFYAMMPFKSNTL